MCAGGGFEKNDAVAAGVSHDLMDSPAQDTHTAVAVALELRLGQTVFATGFDSDLKLDSTDSSHRDWDLYPLRREDHLQQATRAHPKVMFAGNKRCSLGSTSSFCACRDACELWGDGDG